MTTPKFIKSGRITPGMTFDERVWAMTMRIPRGKVTTYGRIAAALGTRAYRAVGAALHRNPHAPTVPCHRLLGGEADHAAAVELIEKELDQPVLPISAATNLNTDQLLEKCWQMLHSQSSSEQV